MIKRALRWLFGYSIRLQYDSQDNLIKIDNDPWTQSIGLDYAESKNNRVAVYLNEQKVIIHFKHEKIQNIEFLSIYTGYSVISANRDTAVVFINNLKQLQNHTDILTFKIDLK